MLLKRKEPKDRMNGKALIKIMKNYGWVAGRTSGSHTILIKEGCRPIPVPVHGLKDLQTGTLRAICRQAGIPYPPK